MRITFVAPHLNMTGGVRALAIYAQRLKDQGHEVCVVSIPATPPSWRRIVKDLLKGRGWPKPIARAPTHFDKTDVDWRVIERIRPIRDSDVPDADIVVATWWETAEWVNALSPRKGVKVHFMQDYETWSGHLDRVDATCRLPMPKIITVEWVGKLLREKFQFQDYTIVPCGVDGDIFNAPPRGKQPAPTVGFNYQLMPSKGSDISLRAYEIARREIPDLRLVMFSWYEPKSDLPVPPDSEYLIKVPDHQLKDVYSRCDAWLFGTRKEGYGLPILEAMACRTPVIGTPAGAAPTLISGGGGILVGMEDPEDMARAIVKIARMSQQEWLEMSDAALATANSYTWDAAASLFEAALLKAAQKQPAFL